MVRNADKYYFPIKASIESILPIVDEYVIALGDNDEGDRTRSIIESIESDKIKIIDRVWSETDFVDGKIYANETTFALSQCTGDWCFYLQADEVAHEKDLNTIVEYCEKFQDRKEVDGFLFQYNHFFGDYQHYLPVHGWYKNEIRIVRNNAGVYSIKDAQSFRKNEHEKLKVVEFAPHIYHYGWVRPPELMQSKKKAMDSMYHGTEKIESEYKLKAHEFDYGALGNIPTFEGTHPAVMDNFIKQLNWQHKLNYSKKGNLNRPTMKHEQLKYRLLTRIEHWLNGGKDIFGYQNWDLL